MLDRLDSLGCCGGSEGGPMCYALQASWSLPRSWLLSVFPGGTSACWRKGTSLCNGKDGAKVSPGWDLLSSSQLHQGQQLMCVGLISAMVMEEKSVILIFFFFSKSKVNFPNIIYHPQDTSFPSHTCRVVSSKLSTPRRWWDPLKHWLGSLPPWCDSLKWNLLTIHFTSL